MTEEMVRGIQKLAANGNDEKGGARAVSALIHQTGMTLTRVQDSHLRVNFYKGRGTKVPQSYTQEGTTQKMSSAA